ncbi:MAG: polysaccharide pyruvyl transferase family protein [Thiobacillus sp.]|nr:polysaccharide pyruvyl transferase family protein [Thiobacillus sp.]
MAGKQRVYHIGIVGSYGGLNLGDEAILQSIVQQIRASIKARITVFSRDGDDTRKRHAIDVAVSTRQLSRDALARLVEPLDLLLVGGGGILFDGEARLFLREAVIAHELRVPYMVYAIGAGPLQDPAAQEAVRDCLNDAAIITVREAAARQVLEEAGVRREIVVTADPALLLRPEPMARTALPAEAVEWKRPVVGMSVREPGGAAPNLSEEVYHQLIANAADFMVDRYGAEIVFVPMERGVLDMQHSHAVVSRMLRPQRAAVLKGEYTPGQLMTLIGRFSFAVGMRLHFMIFSALRHVPFVALPYAAKVGGFLDQIGIGAPPIELVNAGRLIAHIDRTWDRRRAQAQHVEHALPALQAAARATHELMLGLLRARE